MTIQNHKTQSGFTLLELIVVVAVLGLITSLATDFVINDTNQQRYQETKVKLEEIRYAILGNYKRTVNGQPDLSGFVHDMGRLPNDLQELVSEPTDCDLLVAGDQPCSATFNSSLGRIVGWRGPYTSTDVVSSDGWGNSWEGTIASGEVRSNGLDGVLDTAALNNDPYENDAVETIFSQEYLVQLSESNSNGLGRNGITVTFDAAVSECSLVSYKSEADCIANSGTWAPMSVCGALLSVKNGGGIKLVSYSEKDDPAFQDHSSADKGVTYTFRFYQGSENNRVPIMFPYGQMAFNVYKYKSTEECGSSEPVQRSHRITLVPGRTIASIVI